MYLVLESPAGTGKTLVALQVAHRYVMYISRFFGWKSTWATNYVAGSQQPLWLLYWRLWKVRQCWAFAGGYCLPKKCCISHEIFAILYLDKREQDLEDNQETRWSIRAALGLNKQPSTAVERFPKKWQNQTIVMLLDKGRRRNRNRVPPGTYEYIWML